jgi:four helix bundle protein
MKYMTFESMPVWQEAMEIAEEVFRLSEALPRKEDYGLTSQLRRSALSISANLAEGFGRKHLKDKVNFYYHARGSLLETKSHLIYGKNVGYFDSSNIKGIFQRIGSVWRQINILTKSIRPQSKPKSQS